MNKAFPPRIRHFCSEHISTNDQFTPFMQCLGVKDRQDCSQKKLATNSRPFGEGK